MAQSATSPSTPHHTLLPGTLAQRILLVRAQRVMLDADLAQLYGVETKRLNEQVKRNSQRFPADFMFQLSADELHNLKSQIATSNSNAYSGARNSASSETQHSGWGGRRKLPMVFTEHGAIMAASVLNSPRAVQMSVYVVRAFVQLRELLGSHKALADKLEQLEQRVSSHDQALRDIVAAIRALMTQPQPKKRPIGFTADLQETTA
jgi:cell division septum initiation protein DivIVA